MHHSLIVRGATCWRCLGPTVALFTSVECAAACHERWDLYSPKRDPAAAAYYSRLHGFGQWSLPPSAFAPPAQPYNGPPIRYTGPVQNGIAKLPP